MKRRLLLASLLAILPEIGTPAAMAQISHENQMTGSGSGFFISTNGYFLSNYHVVRLAEEVVVRNNNRSWPARVVAVDSVNDIALLKVDGVFAPLALGDPRTASLGDTVFTVGFPNPDLQGIAAKLTKGEINALTGFQDDPRLFQISVPIQPGNSGGPLLDSEGNVIGITTASLDALGMLLANRSLPQNVNYAIKASYAIALLDSVPDARNAIPPRKASKPTDTQALVKSAERAVGLVMVMRKKAHIPSADTGAPTAGLAPYIPTRIQWLAVELNAGYRAEELEVSGFMLNFIPILEEDAIVILVQYTARASRSDINERIDAAKEVIRILTESRGWDSWITVKTRLKPL